MHHWMKRFRTLYWNCSIWFYNPATPLHWPGFKSLFSMVVSELTIGSKKFNYYWSNIVQLEVSTNIEPLKEKIKLGFFRSHRHCWDCKAPKSEGFRNRKSFLISNNEVCVEPGALRQFFWFLFWLLYYWFQRNF